MVVTIIPSCTNTPRRVPTGYIVVPEKVVYDGFYELWRC